MTEAIEIGKILGQLTIAGLAITVCIILWNTLKAERLNHEKQIKDERDQSRKDIDKLATRLDANHDDAHSELTDLIRQQATQSTQTNHLLDRIVSQQKETQDLLRMILSRIK
jgi:DNA anti-recombination protein RmuC